jgi:hypothetical protein
MIYRDLPWLRSMLLSVVCATVCSVKVAVAAPATFVVTTTSDSGAGSLRQAILDANANAGADTITFNIPQSDPNYQPNPDNSCDG